MQAADREDPRLELHGQRTLRSLRKRGAGLISRLVGRRGPSRAVTDFRSVLALYPLERSAAVSVSGSKSTAREGPRRPTAIKLRCMVAAVGSESRGSEAEEGLPGSRF